MTQSPAVLMPEWLNQVDPLHRDSLWQSIQEADRGELIDDSDSMHSYHSIVQQLGICTSNTPN